MRKTEKPPTLAPLASRAKKIWEEKDCRSDLDLDHWLAAERLLLKEANSRKKQIAFELWERRGWQYGIQDRDWSDAEQIVSWEHWAEATLRPYLSIKAKSDPGKVANQLRDFQDEQKIPTEGSTALLLALDGSPEFSRHRYALARSGINGQLPEELVERKDAGFYQLCYESLVFFGAQVTDQNSSRVEAKSPEKRRAFQDACPAVFSGENSLEMALVTALQIRRDLWAYNDQKMLAWPDFFHARIAIGSSWDVAVRCLPYACRDDIVMAGPSLDQLGAPNSPLRNVLVAVGIKVCQQ